MTLENRPSESEGTSLKETCGRKRDTEEYHGVLIQKSLGLFRNIQDIGVAGRNLGVLLICS